MAKMKFPDAARVMQKTYHGSNSADIRHRFDVGGVQAVYLKGGILVIPGTNELADWFNFNFNIGHNQGRRPGTDVIAGDSGALWHAGFLQHARMVYVFAKPLRPKLVIGHSLGAASAQIVGMSLKVPTIAFASPRTHRGSDKLPGEGWVINICRSDDSVCHLPPPFLGFRHVGSRYWLSPAQVNHGEDHRIGKYIELLRKNRHAQRLPKHWPR